MRKAIYLPRWQSSPSTSARVLRVVVTHMPPLAGRSVLGADDPFWDILATSPTESASTTSCRGACATLMSASLLHHFLRSEVVIELGPDAAPHLRWGRCLLPTLLDVEPLRDAAITAGLDDGALLANFSFRTPLELSDGNWTGLAARLGPTVGESSEAR